MRRRRRVVTTMQGVPTIPPEVSERLSVVRGVLTDQMSLYEGALRLGMDIDDLASLCVGARQAVIRTLGEEALEGTFVAAQAIDGRH
jgi:hypothetical protein